MKRYRFLTREDVFKALNKLRAAFLAAKDGQEVDELIKGLLTHDERMKIGRRIILSQLLDEDVTYDYITKNLKIGRQTIIELQRLKDKYPKCFELINKREEKVEGEYHDKAYKTVTSPSTWKKFPEYTGYKRNKIKR